MVQKLTDHLKQTIKKEFIEGYLEDGVRVFPSIDALAKKHQIARATIYRHSNPSKEDWQKQKNKFQTNLERELFLLPPMNKSRTAAAPPPYIPSSADP